MVFMTQAAMNHGIVLFELAVDREQVEKSQKILNLTPQLQLVLQSPVIEQDRKRAVLDRIFQESGIPEILIRFLKVMCEHSEMDEINDIYEAYYRYWDEKKNKKRVRCTFAGEPEPEQMRRIREFLQGKYPGKELVYEICIDPRILGGAVLLTGHEEYDWSYASRLGELGRVIAGT